MHTMIKIYWGKWSFKAELSILAMLIEEKKWIVFTQERIHTCFGVSRMLVRMTFKGFNLIFGKNLFNLNKILRQSE